jgi:hypothetical protein
VFCLKVFVQRIKNQKYSSQPISCPVPNTTAFDLAIDKNKVWGLLEAALDIPESCGMVAKL